MKKIYSILLVSLLLVSCSTEGIDSGNVINTPPGVPELVFPTEDLICTNFNLAFEWNEATDIDGDRLFYIIEIARDAMFTETLFSIKTSELRRSFTFEKGTTYFWRVKAMDHNLDESPYSEVRRFITEPEVSTNTIPQTPRIIAPRQGDTITEDTVLLEWESSDADGDILAYDVYFGETNPPALLVENIDQTIFGASILPNKKYYWRIVAKDNKQGVAIGRVWQFETN